MACILLKCQTMSGILQLIPNTEREKYNQMPVRIHAHRLFTYDPENIVA